MPPDEFAVVKAVREKLVCEACDAGCDEFLVLYEAGSWSVRFWVQCIACEAVYRVGAGEASDA
jgi:hypothetical protein